LRVENFRVVSARIPQKKWKGRSKIKQCVYSVRNPDITAVQEETWDALREVDETHRKQDIGMDDAGNQTTQDAEQDIVSQCSNGLSPAARPNAPLRDLIEQRSRSGTGVPESISTSEVSVKVK
jgi:hypothetical protein